MFLDTNIIAVLGATIASYILGFLCYGPVFGKLWSRLSGISMDTKPETSEMIKLMSLKLLSTFIFTYILAYLIMILNIVAFKDAFILSFLILVGFIATITFDPVLWEKKSFKLYLFNLTFGLVNIALISYILVLF